MIELFAWFIAGAFGGFGLGWFAGRYKGIKIIKRQIEIDGLDESIYDPPEIDIDLHLTRKR
jgi:hypothetical protein